MLLEQGYVLVVWSTWFYADFLFTCIYTVTSVITLKGETILCKQSSQTVVQFRRQFALAYTSLSRFFSVCLFPVLLFENQVRVRYIPLSITVKKASYRCTRVEILSMHHLSDKHALMILLASTQDYKWMKHVFLPNTAVREYNHSSAFPKEDKFCDLHCHLKKHCKVKKGVSQTHSGNSNTFHSRIKS